jgi:hypothetical protein
MKVIELYTTGSTELIALSKEKGRECFATSSFESFMTVGSNQEIVDAITDTFGFPLKNYGGYVIKDRVSLLEYLEFNEF